MSDGLFMIKLALASPFVLLNSAVQAIWAHDPNRLHCKITIKEMYNEEYYFLKNELLKIKEIRDRFSMSSYLTFQLVYLILTNYLGLFPTVLSKKDRNKALWSIIKLFFKEKSVFRTDPVIKKVLTLIKKKLTGSLLRYDSN